ncbi:MAG: Gfo/Idh/MocA family oxidoreductase [Hungatella sp.]
MDQIRTAVIGFGGMGSKYTKLLRDGAIKGMKLSGICCRNAKGQAVIREEYPDAALYRDVTDTFAHAQEFDAVVIVTPHDTHVEIGKLAFQAGKHVFCDKPAGISTKEVKELLAEAEASGMAFAMIFNTRAKPAFQRAKELLETGAVGRLTRAVWVCNTWYRTSCYHHSAPWRSTWSGEHGGLLINQCQHYLDIWQWLLGMPDQIDAAIDFGKYNDFLVDDSLDLRLLYHTGLRGTLISASGETPVTNRFEIWGTKGKLMIEDGARLTLDENVMETTEFDRINTHVYASLEHHLREIQLPAEGDPYQILFQNFSNHIRFGEPLMAPGEEGLKCLEMANGGYLSAWLQKTLPLPIDDDLYVSMLKQKIEQEERSNQSLI